MLNSHKRSTYFNNVPDDKLANGLIFGHALENDKFYHK